jgi:phosphate transport system substrate-binding protein
MTCNIPRSSLPRWFMATALAALPLFGQGVNQTRAVVSPAVQKYKPLQVVTDEVKVPGTDSLADSATEWDSGFRSFHPQSRVSFNAQLSADAIQGLIQGKAPLVLSARDMNQEELAAFQAKNGYAPIRVPICLDAIIVFVNKANPINQVSLEELDAMYSSTRLSGTKLVGDTWGDFGGRNDWKKRPVNPFSREEGAAIRSWFLTAVLRKGGKYKDTVQSRLDAMGLAEAVVTDSNGIAFGSMQAWYSSVKVIPVAPSLGQKAEPPTQEAVYAGKYPLVRSFYLFVNKAPGKPMEPAYLEFARYLLSSNGQNTIADTGFIPAPPDFIVMGSKRLN